MSEAADTRRQILASGLKLFAARGYSGTSVQDIVGAARVTKPALYYHFGNKASLYNALVDQALGEELDLMKSAVSRGADLASKLSEIFAALSQFAREHHELARLAFSAAYGAPEDAPRDAKTEETGARNFEFLHNLLKKELIKGELDRRFESRELAETLFGLVNVYMTTQTSNPDRTLDRPRAERAVKLFLDGASARRSLLFSRNK